ncbi:MAG: hypothetical protein UGF45_13300 [Massilioclostridium sp.]|nr:hypothetical protein [Massilioclostridium sp.]
MNILEAIQEFEDYAYHPSIKENISDEAVALAISIMKREGARISIGEKKICEYCKQLNARVCYDSDAGYTCPYFDKGGFRYIK